MATPKNDPAKKAPAKRATRTKKVESDIKEQAQPTPDNSETNEPVKPPKKNKVVTYVEEEVLPVAKSDVRRFLGFPLWVHYVTGGLILLVFLSLFLFQCNKRKVKANGENEKEFQTQLDRMQESLQRMERERDLDDIRDIEDQKEADQSTQDRRNAQKENREVQNDSKKKE